MEDREDIIRKTIWEIYASKHPGGEEISINDETSLRKDLNFDSLDLAELTVKIEDIFDVDIFENRIVDTVKDIKEELEHGGK